MNRAARGASRARRGGWVGILVSALLADACASASGSEILGPSDAVTRAELEGVPFGNTYLAVARLRPTWVRPRAAPSFGSSPAYPVVYIDGIAQGDIRELERLPVSEVELLRYLGPNDATTRYGTGHTAGAILVTTARR